MTLKEWMEKTNNSQIAVARKVDIDAGRLSRIINGLEYPTLFQAHKIYELTKGRVTYKDWIDGILAGRKAAGKKFEAGVFTK